MSALAFVFHLRTSGGRKNENAAVARKMFPGWLALVSRLDWPKLGWPALPPWNVPSGSLPLNAPCARPSPMWWCTASVPNACGTPVVWGSLVDLPKGCCCNFPRRVSPAVRAALAHPVLWNPCIRCLPLAWTKSWPVRVCASVWDVIFRWMVKPRHAKCSRCLLRQRSEWD